MTTTLDSPSAGPDGGELFDADSEVVDYERSPLDVLRLVLFALGLLVVALLNKYLRDGWQGIEENLTAVLDLPWSWAELVVDVLLVVVVVVASLAVLVVPLVTKRWRLFGYVLAANIATTVLIGALVRWIDVGGSVGASGETAQELARNASIDVVGATQLVAAFVTISPFVSRKWRRAGAWTVAVLIVMRLVVASGTSTRVSAITTGASTVTSSSASSGSTNTV